MSDMLDHVEMLEEVGEVVALEGAYAVIETQPRSACGHCSTGSSCGTSVLGKLFSQRRHQVRLRNDLDLSIGDRAVIGIEPSVMISTAVMAYILPLILMMGFALLVNTVIDTGDGVTFIASMLGLVSGIILSNRIMGGRDFESRDIVLLRHAETSVVHMTNNKRV